MIWDPPAHEHFVDFLVKEAENGIKPYGKHYLKDKWPVIRDEINEKFGIGITTKQVTNHWDITRKAWKVWCPLVAAPVMKWDPVTRTFGATNEEWNSYIEKNPKAVDFRRKVIPCEEKLAFVFKGIIEPGRPFVSLKRKAGQHPSQSQQFHTEPLIGRQDGEVVDDEPTPLRTGDGSGDTQDVPMCTEAEAKMIREAPLMEHERAPVNKYSIGECIEKLDELKEVEQGKELYLFALELFLKKEHRELFLELKDPTVRKAWLLRLQTSGSATAVV